MTNQRITKTDVMDLYENLAKATTKIKLIKKDNVDVGERKKLHTKWTWEVNYETYGPMTTKMSYWFLKGIIEGYNL